MANLNKVMLIGNLTRDPELRYTPKGTAVAESPSPSTASGTTSRDKNRKKPPSSMSPSGAARRNSPSNTSPRARGAYIEGRLQMDTWDDKETGKKRSKLKVVGESLQFMPDGKGSTGGGAAPQGGSPERSQAPQQRSGPPQGASAAPADDFQEEDDIPF